MGVLVMLEVSVPHKVIAVTDLDEGESSVCTGS
jgi:hypothetical protein